MMGPQLATLRRSRRRQSGQAAVESALVLPLALFMILGSLQLFMITNARMMAEYAGFRATRAGSVNHGSCVAMQHAALASLLPTLRPTTSPEELGTAFEAVRENRFGDGYGMTSGMDIGDEEVVWIFRESPTQGQIPGLEDDDFDYRAGAPMQLRITLVYWYPMRIPFADWVLYHMAMASMGIQDFTNNNPLMPVVEAEWEASSPPAYVTRFNEVYSRMQENFGAQRYLFPIQTHHTMRMMTPAKRHHFAQQNCL